MVKKRKVKVKNLVKFVLVLICIVLTIVCSIISIKTLFLSKKDDLKLEFHTPEIKENKLSMIMVGDCLIHGAVYNDARTGNGYNFKPMFTNVKSIIKNYDLKYYNQETILGGSKLGVSTYPRFNSPQEVGDAFLDMGFNIVSLSNNHTLDRGEEAIKNSRKYWNSKEGVYVTGSARSQKEEDEDKSRIMEKNGITYAMLNYTTTTNGLSSYGKTYLVSEYDEEQVKKDVEALRDKVDFLMVAMHWGQEYTHTPVPQEKEIARYLASLNVDLVIGTHPHVIQPIEVIDNTVVIYSLGNFISAQIDVTQLTGLMATLDVKQNEIDGIGVDLKLDNLGGELIYTCRADKCGHYKLYPYSKLTNNILSGFESHYKTFSKIVKEMNKKVKVVGLK